LQPFDYVRPRSLAEVAQLLEEADAQTCILAGGTHLLPEIELGRIRPRLLIDIKAAPELNELRYTNSEGLTLGAAIPISQLLTSPEVRRHYPLLQEVARIWGSVQVRNRATVGGNICQASPAADMVTALLCFDAECRIFGPEGERWTPLERFLLGPGRTALKPNEVLVSVRLPSLGGKSVGAYRFVRKGKGGHVTLAGVAVRAVAISHGVASWRMALAGLASSPKRVSEAEHILEAGELNEHAIHRAAQKAADAAEPIDDARASARYRAALAPVLAERSIRAVARQMWGYGA